MIKKILTILLVCASFSVLAQNTPETKSKGLFDRHEVSALFGFNYTDVTSSKFSPTVGLSYYPTKYVGLRGSTTLSIEDVSAFNNGELSLIARLPLWVVAPYAGVGGRYSSLRSDKFSPVLIGGLETRINKHWSVFAEAVNDLGDRTVNLNDFSFRGGLHLRLK